MNRRTGFAACFCLLLTLLPLIGQCGPVDAEMHAADKRLDTPVTLTAYHIPLGELLERLSAQTGVGLSAEVEDDSSSIEVCVYLNKTPLVDAMNALWSLVSYQEAPWLWKRNLVDGKYTYQFVDFISPRKFAALLRGQVQADFESEAATMLDALKMTPEERKQLAKQNKDLSVPLTTDSILSGLRMFAESLTDQQRLRVLRGQESIRVPLTDLSPLSRTFVLSQAKDSHTMISTNGGPLMPAPEPTWVQFRTTHMGDNIYPTMCIDVAGEGGLGYLGLGQMEAVERSKIAAHWLMPGDKTADVLEHQKLSAPAKSEKAPGFGRGLEPCLKQLVNTAPLSLMALLPRQQEGRSSGLPSLGNGTVGQALAALEGADLMHKWRGHILLFNHPATIFEADARVPYALIKRLRQSEQQHGGHLTLSDMTATAAQLNATQLQWLSDYFRTMPAVARLRSVFVLAAQNPQMTTEAGIPIDEKVLAALRATPGMPTLQQMQQQHATAVRLVQKETDPLVAPANIVEFEMLSGGKVLFSAGFVCDPPKTD